ncbi:MAG: phosphodiester glycosidase family protein [Actinomycetes bacterium]
MSLSIVWTRPTVLLGATVLATGLLVAVPNEADAARPCRIDVTTRLDKTTKFAGGGVSKYYWSTAKGSAVGQYDHQANVIMTTFPAGAYPSLVNKRIGERQAVGEMTKSQAPTALGGINGDFFIAPNIRYEKSIEMARGPMVKDGQVIRGVYQRMRIVGVDTKGQPYGDFFGVRGKVQAKLIDATAIKVRGVNWHKVMGGGATVYTPDWSTITRGDGKATYPRPAGETEWVLNSSNQIISIRNARKNTNKRGDPVDKGTRVVAFSSNTANQAKGVPVGTSVRVKLRQSTTTGVRLRTGVGRGLPVVVDGKPAPLGCRAYARTSSAMSARPRSFVGWDAKGRWRAFTVPGSKLEVINNVVLRNGGFGLANAANIATKLGMTYAYELDGGGSTTLWTRTDQTWTRRDLYKVKNPTGCACERFMSNGLAFIQ